MAPGDRGLKWEGQVLGDRDMATYTLPGGLPSSLIHSLTSLFPQPEGFFFLFLISFPMHLNLHSTMLSSPSSPYMLVITTTGRYTRTSHTSLGAG